MKIMINNLTRTWHGAVSFALILLFSSFISTNLFGQLTGNVAIENATCHESTDGSILVQVTGGEAPYEFEWSNGVSMVSGGAIQGYTLMGHFEDKTYYRSDAPAPNLAIAQADAQLNFGYVASINSEAENTWIFANGAQTGDYIGGTDAIEESSWRWASGEPFVYTNWGDTEPNNSGNEDFIEFRNDGTWNDRTWGTAADDRYIIEVLGTGRIDNLAPGEYTLTVTDANGLSSQRTFEVGPDEIQIDFDVTASSSCDLAINDGGLDALVTGGTAPYNYQWSTGDTEAGISNMSTGSYSLTVTDANDCSTAEATAEIAVDDNTNPTVVVQASTIYLDANGVATVTVDDINNGSFDDCGIANMFVQNPEFGCGGTLPSSDLSAELVVEDAAGNQASALADIIIADTIKPTFNLESIEIPISEEGIAILDEEMLMPFASDNCQIAEVAIQVEEFSCSLVGANQFTEVIVFDVNGNAKQQTLEVILIDDVSPEVSVNDITLELDENGNVALNEEVVDMTILDNCSPAEVLFSVEEFDCSNLGSNEAQVLVFDFGGNSGTAQFNVIVVDNMAPEISGPQVINICEGEEVNFDQINATDNCSAELNLVAGPQGGDTPAAGQYTVEFEATDPSQNSTSFVTALVVSPIAELNLGDDMEVEQGAVVMLTAGDDENNDYLWSNGSTNSTYQFVATEDVTVSVEVTTPEGCTTSDEINISISNPLGIDEDAIQNSARFFPNPTQGEISITLSLTEAATDVRLNITDLSGKSIAQKMLQIVQVGDVLSVDLSNFAEGIYLINLQSDSFNLTERVVKQ